ncbi:Type II toxin-antitoxin system HipA family toxin [Edwardsiella anguillarum]|uniref:Uncharacterized protein n=3 Tax=Edwardsiella TaxID=635 RepID=A0A0H3DRZ7_EDWTF|nr:hypothetical protein ETAE_2254 [Edwardsiella tarda EIB202]ADM42145.1 hypothetical protein ETAF_2039 [Edwardsiella tarda FL6-60]AIJ06733.1 Hypothetical protein ETEE_0253 [Edwardsiella anguillarum ET080813]BET81268.1 Type II toxin-antitoxin system HipA family toxin [Edwardsiella anguillarum]GBK57028.1 hypothetical protein JFPO14_contig00003-0225 [Edwardsiella piscicida]
MFFSYQAAISLPDSYLDRYGIIYYEKSDCILRFYPELY